MRVHYDQKSKEEYEQEKAQFMSLWFYFDKDEEWFDKAAVDKYVRSINNPHYENNRRNQPYRDVSTTRIPTRCPKCKKSWAVEMISANKFESTFLDQSLYKNIPMIKGDCHECKEDK
jgi:hypothetical protein